MSINVLASQILYFKAQDFALSLQSEIAGTVDHYQVEPSRDLDLRCYHNTTAETDLVQMVSN